MKLKFPLMNEAGADGGDGGGGQPPAGAESQGQTQDWRSMLPDDLRESPALKDFSDIGSLAKSFVDTQSYLGNSIRIPTEDASQEARQEFINKLQHKVPEVMIKPNFENDEQSQEFFRTLGMPEDPNGYEEPQVEGMELPEDRREFLKSLAHKNGITNKQFKNFFSELLEADAQQMKQAQEQSTQQSQQGMQELKQEWGYAFDERINQAKQVAQETGAPQALVEAMEKGEAGPDVYRWLTKVGQQLGSEGVNLASQSPKSGGMTPQEAKDQVNDIMSNKSHAYWNPSDPSHKEAVRKVVRLMALSNPEDGVDPNNLGI